jgi:hypothetical protein
MKGSTEHKILRFLKDNDNGDLINVTNLIENRKLLESKLQSLAREPAKYISYNPPIFFFGVGLSNKENNELKAKIEVNGVILLDKIENGYRNININGVYIENNENSKNQSFENIANKKQVISEPNNKPEKKSRLKKILSNPWFIGISLVFLAAVLNAERIKKLLDSIIDGL